MAVFNVKSQQLYCRRPENVAFRNYFWGRDQKLRDEVEGLLSRIEDHVPRILGDLVRRCPPPHGSADRALLLQFLAMHFVRNPAWRAVIDRTLEHQIAVRGHQGPHWADCANSFAQIAIGSTPCCVRSRRLRRCLVPLSGLFSDSHIHG